MNALIYITLGAFGVSAVALWIYCFCDLVRSAVFPRESRMMWLVAILLVPIGGSIAYLSAKKNIEKFSRPDAGKIGEPTADEKEESA